jgi:hypothetical protein
MRIIQALSITEPCYGGAEMAKIVPDYDADADVLYVTVGKPTRDALSFEDESGLIWRQSPDGEWLGVTVPDFDYCWAGRESELMKLIASRLRVPARSLAFAH